MQLCRNHGFVLYLYVEEITNSHDIEDDFEHLVGHAMSYTLENGVGCAMVNGMLRFGSLDEVISDDDL